MTIIVEVHVSNEKRAPGCLGYTGDEILPSCVGTISYTVIRIPSLNNQDSMESIRPGFNSWFLPGFF